MAAARSITGIRSRVLSTAFAGSLLAVAGGTLPAAADQPSARSHFAQMHGAGGGNSARHRTSNLVDHGGKVLASSDLYVVWWGPGGWASDVQSGIASLLSGFNGSSYVKTATQYLRGAAATVTYEGSQSDSSTPPSNPSASTIAAEASKMYPSGDPNGIYLVFTSNFPSGGNFCAWHSYGTVGGVTASVAYMPNTANVAGCDPGNLYGVSGSEGLRSLANVTAHEFMESVTDTVLSAWYDGSGSEIGDKCAWQFAGSVKLSNNTVWQLQEEWSNAVTGCVETS